MDSTAYLLTAVLVAAAITFALRAVPFLLIRPLRSSPLMTWLATRMPVGLMTILVLYLLRDVPAAAPASAITTLACVALVAALHHWRSSPLLSIVAGTTAYVLAVNLLPNA